MQTGPIKPRFVHSVDDFEELLAQSVPHSPDAERAILGAIILDNSLMEQAVTLLEPTDFYIRANLFVFTAMVIMFHEGRGIDPLTLAETLRRDDRLSDVGGVTFLSELTYGLPHFTNVVAYAKIVKDKSKLRDALKIQRMNEALILAQEESAEDILAQVEFNTLEVVGSALRENHRREQEFVDVGQDEAGFVRMLENFHQGRSSGLETPLGWLNDKLEGGGLQPQGLYVIAAAPKVGKTSLLLWFADFWANMLGTPGGILTMEMRREALEMRMFAQHTEIPYWMFRKGFRGVEYATAQKSVGPFFDRLRGKLHIVDSIHTLAQFRHAARRLVLGPKQARWLATDYVQLMSASQDPDPYQRAAESGAVSRGLKLIAQELSVPLVAVSSLNQIGEREGRRPELTDLAWTGNLRYDAEAIAFLHNADYKRAMTREERILFDDLKVWNIDFILAAQRNGPTGERRLHFRKELMQFADAQEIRADTERGPADTNVPFRDEPIFASAATDTDLWLE